MVLVPPGQEMPNLSGVAGLGLLAAGAAALGQEPLDQQLVAPQDSAGCGVIQEPANKCERSSLIQALKGDRELGNTFGNTAVLGQGRHALIACGGRVEGAFQPQWVNWVIRLTSPHLPYMGQAATGAA